MTGDFFDRFQSRVAERPDALAVRCGEASYTYAGLEERAAEIAAGLRAGRADEPSLVAVYLPSGVEAVAAILAVIGRGHGFLGIDAGEVSGEVAEALEHCRPEVVVTDVAGRGRLPGGFSGEVLVIDETGVEGMEKRGSGRGWVAERHPFLCVFRTSGSTGKPKAIVQTHPVICADLDRAVRDTGLCSGDRLDQRFGLSFSAYLSPLAGALLTGGELHLMPRGCDRSEDQAAWMDESGITYSTLTPGMWQHICRGLGEGRKLERVRFLGLSGDRFRRRDLDLLKRHLAADAVVQNAVASTEVRTYLQSFCAAGEVTEERLLATRAVAEKGVSIVGVGAGDGGGEGGGEIVLETRLRSPGEWPGYLQRAEGLAGTEPYFTGDWAELGADGEFRFQGRRSDYVKINGFRVSPKRTERWLCAQSGIEEAVVEAVAGIHGGGGLVLVAFCRVEADRITDLRLLLERAASVELPAHQRPQRWEFVEEFPKTRTGKTDRVRLVADASRVSRTGGVGGEDSRWLREIWSRVLGHDDFSDSSLFFEVGGDSLAANDLALELEKVLGWRVPVARIYEVPTIAGQLRLTKETVGDGGSLLRCLRSGDVGSVLFLIPPFHGSTEMFRNLVAELPEGGAVYGIEIGLVEIGDSEGAVERLAAEAVRSVLELTGGGQVRLCGYSVGGLVAWEVARRLLALGGFGVWLYLLDTYRMFTRLSPEEARWMERRRRLWLRVLDFGMLLLMPGVNDRGDLWNDFVVGLVNRGSGWVSGSGAGGVREKLELLNQRVGLSYPVNPLGCKVVLIRARRQGLLVNALLPDLGWGAFCGAGVEVVGIGCSHQQLLEVGYAGKVAAAIER